MGGLESLVEIYSVQMKPLVSSPKWYPIANKHLLLCRLTYRGQFTTFFLLKQEEMGIFQEAKWHRSWGGAQKPGLICSIHSTSAWPNEKTQWGGSAGTDEAYLVDGTQQEQALLTTLKAVISMPLGQQIAPDASDSLRSWDVIHWTVSGRQRAGSDQETPPLRGPGTLHSRDWTGDF